MHSTLNYTWSVKRKDERVKALIKEARQAVEVASKNNSNDDERNFSVEHSKYALQMYDSLLRSIKDASERENVQETIGKDVAALKNELFLSRKPRIWMAIDNWF